MCVCSLDVPSAPSIERVEPYSSTAMVEFDEPASSGGVPILKYKAAWRIAGQDWTDREYEVEDGKYPTHTHTHCNNIYSELEAMKRENKINEAFGRL